MFILEEMSKRKRERDDLVRHGVGGDKWVYTRGNYVVTAKGYRAELQIDGETKLEAVHNLYHRHIKIIDELDEEYLGKSPDVLTSGIAYMMETFLHFIENTLDGFTPTDVEKVLVHLQSKKSPKIILQCYVTALEQNGYELSDGEQKNFDIEDDKWEEGEFFTCHLEFVKLSAEDSKLPPSQLRF